jgi:hypothetical protein
LTLPCADSASGLASIAAPNLLSVCPTFSSGRLCGQSAAPTW